MPSLEQNTQRKKQLEGFFITQIDSEYLQDIIKIFVFFAGYDQQLDFTKSFHPYELYIALQQQEEDVDLVNCIGQSLFQLIWQKLVIEKKKIFEEYSKGPFGQDSILYPFLCLQRKLTENNQQLLEQITYYTWYESYQLMKASKRIIEFEDLDEDYSKITIDNYNYDVENQVIDQFKNLDIKQKIQAIYGKDNIISFQSKLKKKNQEEQELQLKIKKFLSFEFIQNDEINLPDKYEIEEYKEIVIKNLKERDFIKLNSPFVSSFINEKDKRKEQLNFKLVKDLILSSEEIWQDHCSKYYQSRWQTPHQRNHFKEIIESGQHSRTLAEKLHYFFTEMQTSKQIYYEIKPNYQYFEPEMSFDKLEKYGDKLKVSEKQIQFWKNDQIVLKKVFEKIIQNIKENDSLVQLFLISLFLFDKVDTYAIKNEKFVTGLRKKAKQRQEFIEQNENQFKSQFAKKTKLLQQNKKLRSRRNQIDYSDSESNEDSSDLSDDIESEQTDKSSNLNRNQNYNQNKRPQNQRELVRKSQIQLLNNIKKNVKCYICKKSKDDVYECKNCNKYSHFKCSYSNRNDIDINKDVFLCTNCQVKVETQRMTRGKESKFYKENVNEKSKQTNNKRNLRLRPNNQKNMYFDSDSEQNSDYSDQQEDNYEQLNI